MVGGAGLLLNARISSRLAWQADGRPWPSSRGWSPHVHPLTTLPQLPCPQIFVGPLSRRFPKAEVWVAPRWALPAATHCLSMPEL